MLGNRTLLSKDYFFWLLGFFSTASLLAIPVHGALLTMYTIILLFCFYILIKQNQIKRKKTKLFDLYKKWTIISIVSSMWGILFFWGNAEWQMAAFEYVPKLILYFSLFVLLRSSKNSKYLSTIVLRGLICGIIVNVIVAVIDAVVFYSLGYSIINKYFEFYISISDIRLGMISLVFGPTIRSCGLNSDPANIGLFVTILAAYSLKEKKYWLYGLAILGDFAALSHTGLAGIALVTIIDLYITKRKSFLVNFVSIIAGILIIYSLISMLDMDSINQMSEAFQERTENKLDSDSNSEAARVSYWSNFIKAAIFQPTSLLIGTGYGTASYPYLSNNLVVSDFFPYDPEQTYFSIFFDIGLFGFLLFIKMHYRIIKFSNTMLSDENFTIVYSGLCGIGIAFLFYHYTLYSVAMLFLISGIVLSDGTTPVKSIER